MRSLAAKLNKQQSSWGLSKLKYHSLKQSAIRSVIRMASEGQSFLEGSSTLSLSLRCAASLHSIIWRPSGERMSFVQVSLPDSFHVHVKCLVEDIRGIFCSTSHIAQENVSPLG